MKDKPIPTLWGDVPDERPRDLTKTCPGFNDPWTRPEDRATGTPCCARAGEYNGFTGNSPPLFLCPKDCPCHD